MKSLLEIIKEAKLKKTAVGHFNVSNLEGVKAVFEAARGLNLPVIIGTSEGERNFIGVRQIAALIKSFQEEFSYPIFLNADHTYSLEKVKEAVEAGYDSITFDGSKLSYEENVIKTKEAVEYAKQSAVIIEGELGYIRGSSELHKEAIEIQENDLTNPEQARDFVEKTGVDILAVAVGNIHGMIEGSSVPRLDIQRIKAIKDAVKIPLVLHGGSGISDEDFLAAIDAGISIIHINTELRLAWRQGLEKALKDNPEEIVPYKILPPVVETMKKVIDARLKLFNKLV